MLSTTKSFYKSNPLPEEMIRALRASFRGELIQPGEPDYDSARRVWNGMIDKYPALIVRVATFDEVWLPNNTRVIDTAAMFAQMTQ